jgi:hypothetical protein
MLSYTEDKTFLDRVCFSDEAIFHTCGTVKTQVYGEIKILTELLNISMNIALLFVKPAMVHILKFPGQKRNFMHSKF